MSPENVAMPTAQMRTVDLAIRRLGFALVTLARTGSALIVSDDNGSIA